MKYNEPIKQIIGIGLQYSALQTNLQKYLAMSNYKKYIQIQRNITKETPSQPNEIQWSLKEIRRKCTAIYGTPKT